MQNKNTIDTKNILKNVFRGTSAFLWMFLVAFTIIFATVDPSDRQTTYYTQDGVALDDLIFINRLTQNLNSQMYKREVEEQIAFIERLEKVLLNEDNFENEVALDLAIETLSFEFNSNIKEEDLAFIKDLEKMLTTEVELALSNETEIVEASISDEDLAFIKSLEKALSLSEDDLYSVDDIIDIAFENDNSKYFSSGLHAE